MLPLRCLNIRFQESTLSRETIVEEFPHENSVVLDVHLTFLCHASIEGIHVVRHALCCHALEIVT